MDLQDTNVGKMDLGASPGADRWKDVLQLLKEQNVKMERLARALSIIQQGMLRNNPRHVRESVNEASQGFDVLMERLVGGPTSRMPRSAAKIHPIKGRCYASRGVEKGKSSFEARHKEKPTSMLERLDR